MPFDPWRTAKRQKHTKEQDRAARQKAKATKKAARRAPDPDAPVDNLWPDAPELLAGVAKTLSHGGDLP